MRYNRTMSNAPCTIDGTWYLNTRWDSSRAYDVRLMWILGVATLFNIEDAICIKNCILTSAGGTFVLTPEMANFFVIRLILVLS